MKETVRNVIETLGYERGKFAVIAHDDREGNVVSMGFNTNCSKNCFLTNVDTTPRQPLRFPPALQKDLKEANKLFRTTGFNRTTEKVNIIASP